MINLIRLLFFGINDESLKWHPLHEFIDPLVLYLIYLKINHKTVNMAQTKFFYLHMWGKQAAVHGQILWYTSAVNQTPPALIALYE